MQTRQGGGSESAWRLGPPLVRMHFARSFEASPLSSVQKNRHATQANEKPAQMTGKFHKTLAHGKVKILKKHTYTLFSTEVFLLTIIPWPGSYSFTNT